MKNAEFSFSDLVLTRLKIAPPCLPVLTRAYCPYLSFHHLGGETFVLF